MLRSRQGIILVAAEGLGLVFMITLGRMGRKTRDLKSEGKSFTRSKEFHGRISDVMVMMVVIHAFPGFLYLLNIL